MKKEASQLHELRTKYNDLFKTGEPKYRSFHDLLWQISINEMYTNEKDGEFIFTVSLEKGENELVVAFADGGYRKTGVCFVNPIFHVCSNLVKQINTDYFELSENEQTKIISKSMGF